MDVVVFFNGLGNQMSQYAFYLSKCNRDGNVSYLNICKEHNGLELNRLFHLNIKTSFRRKVLYLIFKILITRKLASIKTIMRLFGFKAEIVDENFNYNFNEKYLIPSKNLSFYYGGWPSEKYFINVKDKVLEAFKFPAFEDEPNLKIQSLIESCNSVAIHVRRGDYLSAENLEIFGRVCTKEYFEKAIAIINQKVATPHFFIFSNDIDWVKANLKFETSTIIDFNSGSESWKDMALMSKCHHNIISNSTFSWWGAYLNTNENKIIISPSRYLNNDVKTDFYPEDWTRLTDY